MINTVGIVNNNVSDPFYRALFASLDEVLRRHGRTPLLCRTGEDVSRQTKFIRSLAQYNADGLIVFPAIGSTPIDFPSPQTRLPPTVFVSRIVSELEFDHVVNDDRTAARIATERLLSLGHRRIAVVGGDPRISCFRERLRGYREALGQACVAFDSALVRSTFPRLGAGFDAARWIAELSPRPTAAIAYRNLVALGLFAGLEREGLFPGRSFALIGNEDVEETALTNPPLSVTSIAQEEMGAQAAETLVERICSPDSPPRRIVLKPELLVRGTCNVRSPAGSEPKGPIHLS